jgi:Cu(I)/Ag(I) efflux system membrane fusion protein
MTTPTSADDNPAADHPPRNQPPGDHPPAADGPPRGVATMSIVRWGLVAIAAVVAVVSILSYAGVHVGGAPSTSSAAAETQLYTCPMHPSIVQDHPGECPICSMTLVPKPVGKLTPGSAPTTASATTAAGEAPVPGLSAVDLPPERIQLIGMKTATVTREALGGELRTVGVVAANERGLAQITTRFSGWVQKLLVSETGERVRRGQALATIYSPDVLRAEQELLVAAGWNAGADAKPGRADPHGGEELAAGLVTSSRRRLELLGISAQEIDDVLRTGKAVAAIAIR